MSSELMNCGFVEGHIFKLKTENDFDKIDLLVRNIESKE